MEPLHLDVKDKVGGQNNAFAFPDAVTELLLFQQLDPVELVDQGVVNQGLQFL